MALITDLKPLNLVEEKTKFFKDFSYNPQFRYKRSFSQKELTKYGLPKEKFFKHAQKILATHGGYRKLNQLSLTLDQIKEKAQLLFIKLGIKPLDIVFTASQSGRILLRQDRLSFKLPILFGEEQYSNILNHEVQTHYLRKINDNIQNLNSVTKNNTPFRLTEEGLANLHSFVEKEDKIIKKTYLNYISTYLAQTLSFSELFQTLNDFNLDVKRTWNITLKQKRGLEDTSQPGGFSKDLVYFEGIVMVWKWMQNPDNDPKDLYLGRISLDDVAKTKLRADSTQSIYPTFFENMELYKQNILKIGEVNNFPDLID